MASTLYAKIINMTEIITDSELYLQGLLAELEKKQKKAVFRVNDQITDSVAGFLRTYFKDKPEYYLELRKCAACKNSYDVILTLKNC